MAYNILLYIHSWMRYVVVILLLVSFIKAFSDWKSKKLYSGESDKLFLFAFISTHIQLLLGIVLYFISPTTTVGFADMGAAMRNTGLRFWVVEHAFGMLVAVGLITFGRARAKKAELDYKKFKTIAFFYGFGLLIMLLTIPWPFMAVARPWFRF